MSCRYELLIIVIGAALSFIFITSFLIVRKQNSVNIVQQADTLLLLRRTTEQRNDISRQLNHLQVLKC